MIMIMGSVSYETTMSHQIFINYHQIASKLPTQLEHNNNWHLISAVVTPVRILLLFIVLNWTHPDPKISIIFSILVRQCAENYSRSYQIQRDSYSCSSVNEGERWRTSDGWRQLCDNSLESREGKGEIREIHTISLQFALSFPASSTTNSTNMLKTDQVNQSAGKICWKLLSVHYAQLEHAPAYSISLSHTTNT